MSLGMTELPSWWLPEGALSISLSLGRLTLPYPPQAVRKAVFAPILEIGLDVARRSSGRRYVKVLVCQHPSGLILRDD